MTVTRSRQHGIDHRRLYEYRFRGIGQGLRADAWRSIAAFVHRELGAPRRVLDPAAGRGEFINAVPAPERWAVDLVDYPEGGIEPGVKLLIGDVMDVDLPEAHFDGVLVSNFLEHLPSQDGVADFLARMAEVTAPGGSIAVIGPNFKYCAREYFDCADHTLALSHIAVAEHLYAAGFEPARIVPRFLPYSFRGRLPARRGLVEAYLRVPAAWRVLGKQFLVVGRR